MAVKVVSNSGGNYNVGSTWVGGVTPLTTDTIEFTATSGQLTINVASTCAGINFTNYVNTLTINLAFTINGVINFGSGAYNVVGSNTMYAGSTAVITSNGVAWKGNFGFIGATLTYTLADNLTINGTFTNNCSGTGIVNGFNIFAKSNVNSTGGILNGTTNLYLIGTGTWSSNSNSTYIGLNTTISTVGTITFGVNLTYGVGIFNYVAGIVITAGSLFSLRTSATLNTTGITFFNVQCLGVTQTLTLGNQLLVSSTFTNSITLAIGGSFGITCGNFTNNANLNLAVGSTTNISGTLTSVGTAAAPITIKTVTNGQRANMILSSTGNQDVAHTSGRDIDSDGGLPIMSYRAPSIINCDNWMLLPIITSINTNLILK